MASPHAQPLAAADWIASPLHGLCLAIPTDSRGEAAKGACGAKMSHPTTGTSRTLDCYTHRMVCCGLELQSPAMCPIHRMRVQTSSCTSTPDKRVLLCWVVGSTIIRLLQTTSETDSLCRRYCRTGSIRWTPVATTFPGQAYNERRRWYVGRRPRFLDAPHRRIDRHQPNATGALLPLCGARRTCLVPPAAFPFFRTARSRS
jgi:hypothetical protein